MTPEERAAIPRIEAPKPKRKEGCGKARKAREGPPLHTQAVSFVMAMGKLAADGFRLADEEEFKRRVAICESCGRFNSRTGRCRECGCYGKIKAKGRIWECPEGKWQKQTEEKVESVVN